MVQQKASKEDIKGTNMFCPTGSRDQTNRKGKEDKADRGRGGETTSGNGQALSSASPRGQWRTGKNGENWLQNHL